MANREYQWPMDDGTRSKKIVIESYRPSFGDWAIRTTYKFDANDKNEVNRTVREAESGLERWQRCEPKTTFRLAGDVPREVILDVRAEPEIVDA
jgi:hypothetical protein